jgi:hypothetical protein
MHCYGGMINKASINGQVGNAFPMFYEDLLNKTDFSNMSDQVTVENLQGSISRLVHNMIRLPFHNGRRDQSTLANKPTQIHHSNFKLKVNR